MTANSRKARHTLEDAADDLAEAAPGKFEAAKESIQEGVATVRDRSREVANATNSYVRDRPWTALGIAAVVGAVLGALSARR